METLRGVAAKGLDRSAAAAASNCGGHRREGRPLARCTSHWTDRPGKRSRRLPVDSMNCFRIDGWRTRLMV